jgi:hypothetical protein
MPAGVTTAGHSPEGFKPQNLQHILELMRRDDPTSVDAVEFEVCPPPAPTKMKRNAISWRFGAQSGDRAKS